MMPKARTPEDIARLVTEHLAGRVIEAFQVFGVNSLKTMDPSPTALRGECIRNVKSTSESTFTLVTDSIAVDVDLQRTGELRWSDELISWSFGQPSMPTAQLRLRGGGGVNFAEPTKTRRITFRIHLL